MASDTSGTETPQIEPSEIAFFVHDRPGSYFYELQLWFDGRLHEISGSRMIANMPEDQIMRAALRILMGDDAVDIWLDGQPGLTRLTFTVVRNAFVSPMTLEAAYDLGCRITRTECHEDTREPLDAPVLLGVVQSAMQLAAAAYDMGHQAYGFQEPGGPRPMALMALKATLDAVYTG